MAKPKLALLPAAQGSKFYSVLPSSGVGDFDFTRSGSATRINSQGLIETVAIGVSRLNYPLIDGVVKGCPHHILEPQRTQKIQYSEDFSQSYWTKTGSSITSNVAISPDGSLNADKLVEGTSLGSHQVQRNLGTISGNVTFSIYAKSSERNIIFINAYTGSSNRTFFDLSNGNVLTNALGSTAKIELLPNGYYRCSVERVANALVLFEVGVSQADGVISYTGDGTSGVYIYGAMLEQGSYPTSYIPNYGTSAGVTRSAETANGSGDAATFNSEQGVLMAEISGFENTDTSNRFISILNGANANNGFYLFYGGATNRIRFQYNTSTENFNFITTDFNSENNNKIAFKYKSNDISIWVNGIEVKTDTTISSTPVGLDNLSFNRSGSEPFYGNTKQLQYFDTALTDSDLETLTSWVSFTDMAEAQLYSVE